MATRSVNDTLGILRLAISRRNENDPDSNDTVLLQYLNDFIALTMSDEVKVFEEFGTLIFTIDESSTTGVYTFNDVGATHNFTNISQEAMISLTDPADGSVSWNQLWIYQDPGSFYSIWGVNNDDILIPGYPTMMLYYGDEMTFRTIPNDSYTVYIWGYKEIAEFATDDGDANIPYAYWMRYLAYGAALNYAQDYNFDQEHISRIRMGYARERKLLLTRSHNQRKVQRCLPRF